MKNNLMKILIFIFCFQYPCFAQKEIYDIERYCEAKYAEAVQGHKNKKLAEVIQSWQKNANICDVNGIYERYLAELYAGYNDFATAESILENTIQEADFDTKELKFLLGAIYNNCKEFTKYKRLTDEMVSLYPNWFGGYYHLGTYCFSQDKNYHESQRLLEKALSLVDKKNCYIVFCALALAEYKLGNYSKVLDYYKQAFFANPIYTMLSKDLAIATIYSAIEVERYIVAENVIKNIEKLDPEVTNDAGYLEAKAYYEQTIKTKK